jgi:hypothetical protein
MGEQIGKSRDQLAGALRRSIAARRNSPAKPELALTTPIVLN